MGGVLWVAHMTNIYSCATGYTPSPIYWQGDAPRMDTRTETLYAAFSPNGLVNQGFPGMTTHITAGQLECDGGWVAV
jgi:hypothetical protein